MNNKSRHLHNSLWENTNFTLSFWASSLSNVGDWLDFIAVVTLFSYVWKSNPMVISLLPVVYAVPGILLSQTAGILADRMNKLTIMICTDFIRFFFTIILLLAPTPLWMLLTLLFRSTAGVFHLPAQQALLRYIVKEEHILKATAINGTVFQLAKVFGPIAGAALVTIGSYKICLAINASSFILSALFLLFVKTPSTTESEPPGLLPEKLSFKDAWQEGWNIILQHRVLFSSFLFSFLVTMIIQVIDVQLTVLLRNIFPGQTEIAGWIVSAVGLGAVCSAALLNRLSKVPPYGLLLGGSSLIIGISIAWLGMLQRDTNIIWPLLCALLCGTGLGFSFVCLNVLIQKEIPRGAVGRVYGIYNSILNALFIISPLLGGLLITAYGPAFTFQIVGSLAIVVGGLGLLLRKQIWRTKRTDCKHALKKGEKQVLSK